MSGRQPRKGSSLRLRLRSSMPRVLLQKLRAGCVKLCPPLHRAGRDGTDFCMACLLHRSWRQWWSSCGSCRRHRHRQKVRLI